MDFHFKRLMRWWGKPYGEYELIKGDFCDAIHNEKISSATLIFANNAVFDPSLDLVLQGYFYSCIQLSLCLSFVFIDRFSELEDGVRIVTSKPLCPVDFQMNDRVLNGKFLLIQFIIYRILHFSSVIDRFWCNHSRLPTTFSSG